MVESLVSICPANRFLRPGTLGVSWLFGQDGEGIRKINFDQKGKEEEQMSVLARRSRFLIFCIFIFLLGCASIPPEAP